MSNVLTDPTSTCPPWCRVAHQADETTPDRHGGWLLIHRSEAAHSTSTDGESMVEVAGHSVPALRQLAVRTTSATADRPRDCSPRLVELELWTGGQRTAHLDAAQAMRLVELLTDAAAEVAADQGCSR